MLPCDALSAAYFWRKVLLYYRRIVGVVPNPQAPSDGTAIPHTETHPSSDDVSEKKGGRLWGSHWQQPVVVSNISPEGREDKSFMRTGDHLSLCMLLEQTRLSRRRSGTVS